MDSKEANKNLNNPLSYLEYPYPSKGIWAYLINLITILLLAFALYYLPGRAILTNTSYYKGSLSTIHNKETEHGLVLEDNLSDYQIYRDVVDEFYLVSFPTELEKNFNSQGNYLSYTIEHIYNVKICNLPANPTSDNHESEFFTYKMVDGKYDVDSIAALKSDLTEKDFKGLASLYNNAYRRLFTLLQTLDYEYYSAKNHVSTSEALTRMLSALLPALALELLIPLFSKNGESLGELLIGYGYVNKNGYRYKKYKSIFRFLINAPLLLLTFYIYHIYAFILLLLLPVSIDGLLSILSKNAQRVFMKFSYLRMVYPKRSEIFSNEEEFNEYLKKEVLYSDQEYTDLLSSINPIKEEEGK